MQVNDADDYGGLPASTALSRQEIASLLAKQMIREAVEGTPAYHEDRDVAEGLALRVARDIVASGVPYVLVAGDKAIMCLTCGMVSNHPQDVSNRYCANCKKFHEGGAV
jgi:hypothetical protein